MNGSASLNLSNMVMVLLLLMFMLMSSTSFAFLQAPDQYSFLGRIGCCQKSITIRHGRLFTATHSTPDKTDDTPKQGKDTALLWLSCNRLRIRDNLALTRAAELGPDGLAICVVWPNSYSSSSIFGKDEITPVEAFGYAAMNSLNDSLGEMGQKLWLMPPEVAGEEDYDPVSTIADAIQRLKPAHVIVDTCILDEHFNHASRIRDKLQSLDIIENANNINYAPSVEEVMDEGLLIPFDKVPKALGRSRQGGRALRWSAFLGNTISMMDTKELDDKPIFSLTSLPPPLLDGSEEMISTPTIPNSASFPSWAQELLLDWGDASEDEAIRRASRKTQHQTEVANASSQLTEKGSKDSKLSPYLRWGIISPQRAANAGVRTRDLLWRDWSHICFKLLGPLRRGDPVLDFMDKCNNCISPNELNADENELFNLWCVGNTGSQLVDAGMRQLWQQGWMPRQIRLLAAACLVEGLGLDWRLGRDWFKHTLIDHDDCINELMWQNAGLCGVDPFYNGMAWERIPKGSEEDEYVKKWANKQLSWPSYLKPYAERSPPAHVLEIAESRRDTLRANGVYKAARTVSNSGVRVAWPGLVQQSSSVAEGEVMGVGLKPIDELRI